ncbi:MAG: hypothetical protein AAB071_00470 [Bacteroidota bacterium]
MQKKKPPETLLAEYRFIIQTRFDENSQKEFSVFILETTRIFRSFRYHLLVKERHEKKSFSFAIEGLSMSRLSIPETGPAQFVLELPLLKGEYNFSVFDLNKVESSFTIKFAKGIGKIVKMPSLEFLELSVNEE